MQKYYFKSEIENIEDGDIFVSDSGNGYVQDGEMHITENNYHFVYKFGENIKGWYMKNIHTEEDVFLGEGASPTAEYEVVDIKNQINWEKIVQQNVDERTLENLEGGREE